MESHNDEVILLSKNRSVYLTQRYIADVIVEVNGVNVGSDLKAVFRNVSAWDILEVLRKHLLGVEGVELNADKGAITATNLYGLICESTNRSAFTQAIGVLEDNQIKLRNVAYRFHVRVKERTSGCLAAFSLSSGKGDADAPLNTIVVKGFPCGWLSRAALATCEPYNVPLPFQGLATGALPSMLLAANDMDTSFVAELLGFFGPIKAVDVADACVDEQPKDVPGSEAGHSKRPGNGKKTKHKSKGKAKHDHKRLKLDQSPRQPPLAADSSSSSSEGAMTDSDSARDLDKEERRFNRALQPQWPLVDASAVYVQFDTTNAFRKAVGALCKTGQACLTRQAGSAPSTVLCELKAVVDMSDFMDERARRRRKFDRDGHIRLEVARHEKIKAALADVQQRRRDREHKRREEKRLRVLRREQRRLERIEREQLEAERQENERLAREREERRRAAEDRLRKELEAHEQRLREEKERAEKEALEAAVAEARETKRMRCARVFRVLLEMALDTKRGEDVDRARRDWESMLIEREKTLEGEIEQLELRKAQLEAALRDVTRPKRKLKSVIYRPKLHT